MREYQIAKGDTLEGLSAFFKIPICMILRANEMERLRLMRVGRRVIIPDPDYCARLDRKCITEKREGIFLNREYTVCKGDTVFGIARTFNTTMECILSANGVSRPDEIRIGQRIVVPCLREGFIVYLPKTIETLEDVAARFGICPEQIERYNELSDGLYPGIQLIIPAFGEDISWQELHW